MPKNHWRFACARSNEESLVTRQSPMGRSSGPIDCCGSKWQWARRTPKLHFAKRPTHFASRPLRRTGVSRSGHCGLALAYSTTVVRLSARVERAADTQEQRKNHHGQQYLYRRFSQRNTNGRQPCGLAAITQVKARLRRLGSGGRARARTQGGNRCASRGYSS